MLKQVWTLPVVQSSWLVEGIEERQKKQNKYKNNIIYFALFISVSRTRRLNKTARIGRTGNNCLLQDFVLYLTLFFVVKEKVRILLRARASMFMCVCVPSLTADEPTKRTSLISCNYMFRSILNYLILII